MDALENIMSRKSVRKYLDIPISDQMLEIILRAAMAGPSCVNARDWSFIVTRNPDIMKQMAEANGRPADPLKEAKLGILVLGDLERAFKPAPDYWIIDCAIASQNMILAANAMGIGFVWLGTWPQMERVDRQRALFQLPDNVVPHSIIAFGFPAYDNGINSTITKDALVSYADPAGIYDISAKKISRGTFESDRIHVDRWQQTGIN